MSDKFQPGNIIKYRPNLLITNFNNTKRCFINIVFEYEIMVIDYETLYLIYSEEGAELKLGYYYRKRVGKRGYYLVGKDWTDRDAYLIDLKNNYDLGEFM